MTLFQIFPYGLNFVQMRNPVGLIDRSWVGVVFVNFTADPDVGCPADFAWLPHWLPILSEGCVSGCVVLI